MTTYHYDIQLDLKTLELKEDVVVRMFGSSESITLLLDTESRLVKDEFLMITTIN